MADKGTKLFDIDADTTGLAKGEHTVTYFVKFTNNKTCELITLKLNVGGESVDGDGCMDGSESSSESGSFEEVGGCGSSLAVGVGVPIITFAGFMLCKKKKEN